MSPRVWLRRLMFGISGEEASFSRRGFSATNTHAQEQLEQSGRAFIGGYNLALANSDALALADDLNRNTRQDLRGFAFEGAAMGLALLDWMTFSNLRRWAAFAQGPGAAHIYMVHVGAGWAAARVPWVRRRIEGRLSRFDPLLRWLVLDGYGFHQGYFDPQRSVVGQQRPAHLSAAGQHAFDQGLGRSLWFVGGADVERIAGRIAAFAPLRRGDLWSGVGLASTYAGGVDRGAIEALASRAGEYQPQVAQGAAFGAKARQRAGNSTAHAELACRILCGMSANQAAAVTDESLRDLAPDGDWPAYEVWRRRIQAHFPSSPAGAARAAANV